MDSFLPNTSKVLLGILAAAFLLFVVALAIIYSNQVTYAINVDNEASRYQQEYALLSRYESTKISIAYTEVLNAAYVISEKTRPVIVVDDEFWCMNDPQSDNSLLRFPLPVNELIADFGLNMNQSFTPNGMRGLWASVPYQAGEDQSTYKKVSEWLANKSRTNSRLSFKGEVLRNDSGTAYAIVFIYQANQTPAGCL